MFSGDPKKAGAKLSKCWERAGGKAEPRDIKINDKHDFFKDDRYWDVTAANSPYAVHFAPDCGPFSVAHTIPKLRSLENPIGDESNEKVFGRT